MSESVLVVLEENADAVIPYAVSVAKALGAHATAVYPRRDPTGLEDGSMKARTEAISGMAETRKAQARLTLRRFAESALSAGVEVEILEPEVGQDPPRDVLPRFARAFAFAMVQQQRAGHPPAHDDLTASLLAESGRPVLIVPAIQRAAANIKRIIVAWDGSAAAARAFSEANALFAGADRVEIVTIANANTAHSVIQGGRRLAARLARAGVAGEFRPLPGDVDPANALLSYAADFGGDIMVSGGYSHSPLRESLFGGVTRTLLSSMTIPLFLVR